MRYGQQETLSEGGQEVLLRAHDSVLDRLVSMRTLPVGLKGDAHAEERFRAEAVLLGKLQHPGIPSAYALEEHPDGGPVLCSQWVDGDTLEVCLDRLRNGDQDSLRQFSWVRRLQIVQRICEALELAHSKGYQHGELTTRDILLGRFGEVLTLRWTQASKMEEGPAPDLLALGKLMYVLFTLSPPAAAPKVPENVRHPHQGRVPREISRLIMKVLTGKEKSAASLQDELQTIVEGESRPVCPHTTVKYGMNRMGRLLDDHNLWLAPIVILWLAWPLKDIFKLLWGWLIP